MCLDQLCYSAGVISPGGLAVSGFWRRLFAGGFPLQIPILRGFPIVAAPHQARTVCRASAGLLPRLSGNVTLPETSRRKRSPSVWGRFSGRGHRFAQMSGEDGSQSVREGVALEVGDAEEPFGGALREAGHHAQAAKYIAAVTSGMRFCPLRSRFTWSGFGFCKKLLSLSAVLRTGGVVGVAEAFEAVEEGEFLVDFIGEFEGA